MNIGGSFKLAFRGLLVNKARSLLALLGIIIGIGAVITITALAEGLKAQVAKQIQEMGTNLVFVVPQPSANDRRSHAGYTRPPLFTQRELRAIEAGLRIPVTVTAMVQDESSVAHGRESVSVPVQGVDDNYARLFNFDIAKGRMLTPGEISGGRRVAVLGWGTTKDLFGDDDPVGQYVDIGGNRFEVIGVAEEQGAGLGDDPDKTALVPLKVAQQRLFGLGDKVLFLAMQIDDLNDLDVVKEDVRRALNRVRRIDDRDDENYEVLSQTDALEQFGQFVNVLTMVLGGVAAVSLLVGGIGIMNIMLVSVTERTREIGLRKAVGARQVDILFQFLIEAIVLCLLGGIIGMGLGYGGATGLSALIRKALPEASWSPAISVLSVVVAIAFSTAVGLIFGVYPAANAARKDPIAALRYE
jgi:ABC-type antimicrobial peptide transport system permease subunit